MCGIVYKRNFDGTPVNQAIKQIYKNQRARGTEGFGFYVPERDQLAHNTREHRILNLLGRTKASEILFHHRWPTSTDNVQTSCHPFSTRSNSSHFDTNYILVHNGIVTNSHTLKTAHEALGIKYISEQSDGRFNDSEALLYDIALYLDGKQAQPQAKGAIAFIVRTPERLFFGRNSGSPLNMKLTSRGLTLSSEGKGDSIPVNQLHEFIADKHEVVTSQMELQGYSYIGYDTTYTTSQYQPSGASGYHYNYTSQYGGAGSAHRAAAELVDDCGSLEDAIEFMEERTLDLEVKVANHEAHQLTHGFVSAQYDWDEQDLYEAEEVLRVLKTAQLSGVEEAIWS